MEGEELRRLFAEARAGWPGIEVPFERFAGRFEHGGSAPAAADLYIACACADGDPAALAQFDRRFVDGAVRDAVARIDRSEDFVAEVLQRLRERLFVGPDAKIDEYRGSGALAGWVRTVAVRVALQIRRSAKVQAKHADALESLAPLLDHETALLKHQHLGEVNAALGRALDELDADARLLLRLHYVECLTLSKIAVLHQVGISTVSRRLSAATQAVLLRVKRELTEQCGLSQASVESLLRGAAPEIDLSISQILGGR
jgi:RNA polymerase sigma-70 factor (ECF subfamily)